MVLLKQHLTQDEQVCMRLVEILAGSDLDANAGGESGDAMLEVNQVNTVIVELPNLRVLSLIYLQKLESICQLGLLCCKSLEEITVVNCRELKKLPLALDVLGVLSAPPSLQKI